ncbi:hypothetical protein ECEC4402_5954, partial [Escherichia coli EC4402]
MYPRKV